MADGKPAPKATKRKRAKAPAKAKATAGTKRKTGARATTKTKASAARRVGSASGAKRARGGHGRATVLPRDLVKSIEDGQRATLDAVRKFVDTVERALPGRGNGASRRQEVVDSALEMAERLVQTQYDLLRKAVRSAGRTVGGGGSGKRS
jgi:hypothetical protein